MKRILSFALLLSLGSCTVENADSSSGANADATRVFAAQKGAANTAVLTGIWEGSQPQVSGPLTSTSRFEFRDAFVVAAARCTRTGAEPVVVGGRSPANVSTAVIEIQQSISDTKTIGSDAACAVRATAGSLPACDPSTPPANRTTCFELTGTTLDIYQGSAGIQSFLKIAD